jgi:hypothetical protein
MWDLKNKSKTKQHCETTAQWTIKRNHQFQKITHRIFGAHVGPTLQKKLHTLGLTKECSTHHCRVSALRVFDKL